MSHNFRAVTETWGADSSCFLEHEDLLAVLSRLADAADTQCSETEYGDKTSFWVDNGKAFLDYLTGPDLNPDAIASDACIGIDQEDDFSELLHNMKGLAPEWRKSIGTHGELFFYID